MSYDTACTSCGHHCKRTKHDSVFPVPKEVPQKRWGFGSRQYRGSAASVLPLLPACLGLLATLHSNQGSRLPDSVCALRGSSSIEHR